MPNFLLQQSLDPVTGQGTAGSGSIIGIDAAGNVAGCAVNLARIDVLSDRGLRTVTSRVRE